MPRLLSLDALRGVAMVWMPYDLYVNGAWSHCGADVFTLVKSAGRWRIASMAWSARYTVAMPPRPSCLMILYPGISITAPTSGHGSLLNGAFRPEHNMR